MTQNAGGASGSFVDGHGIEWYRIDGYDRLDPFLITVVAPTDQWMYVSTCGALTAGRVGADGALFGYETDDRLHRMGGRMGPVTLVRLPDGGLWEPFAADAVPGRMQRTVMKTATGDRLRFEEHHPGAGITFRYAWSTADRFGFIRTAELIADPGAGPMHLEILDGLVDVLPAGVDLVLQQTSSTLVDAYRRSEYQPVPGIALFTLEALLTDRPEPAESLTANVVWSAGLEKSVVTLSERAVARFRAGETIQPDHLVTGRKGSFLLAADLTIAAGSPAVWWTVADAGLDHLALARLQAAIAAAEDPGARLAEATETTTAKLIELIGGADAVQVTADRAAVTHHFANVLFNCMRGGVFRDGHRVEVSRFQAFLEARNRPAAARFAARGTPVGGVVEIGELRDGMIGDPDLERLAAEYLPLVFSRRHGDPSRPWNTFRIPPTEGTGRMEIGYQGNWRDIFQNWEALCHSYPEYLESVVLKFLNASTLDGFNPYRITDRGIDWETPEEGAWSHFGYWGDHQIAYLHRLVDALRRFRPGRLEALLERRCSSYADVPYRLAAYEAIVADPKHTITFDRAAAGAIDGRVAAIGADGRLVPDAEGGGVHHATVAEKLLVPALSKLSNLVVDGGVWMNTQRPEWNDANNALVGYGVSMVTLSYLREYTLLLDDLLASGGSGAVYGIGEAVAGWMEDLRAVFDEHRPAVEAAGEVDPGRRRRILDALGSAFSDYRAAVYGRGPGPTVEVSAVSIRSFLESAAFYLDRSMGAARREDGLFESYGLLRLGPGTAEVEPLYPMLEGQVAAVESTAVTDSEVIDLLDCMAAGPLYREDQRTFLLYPRRTLPGFSEKNVVPADLLGPALERLLASGDDSILTVDAGGEVRFRSSMTSAGELERVIDERFGGSDDAGGNTGELRREALEAYEAVFRHRSFTGRSGTMYRYEGLGSVYWHMVSKLVLAVQERLLAAHDAGADPALAEALSSRYHRVRSGLGYLKTPEEYGAFPTDPHSHTPFHTGAQQPGMTGQVKEGILLRWGELGIRISDGGISFRPVLLGRHEFLPEARYDAQAGTTLEAGTLGFTYCGVPVVYRMSDEPWLRVTGRDGRITVTRGDRLDANAGRALFARNGAIREIEVGVPADMLSER